MRSLDNVERFDRDGSKRAAVLISESMLLTNLIAARSKHETITRSFNECSLMSLQHASASGVCSDAESDFISRLRTRLFDSKRVSNSSRLGTPTLRLSSSDKIRSAMRCDKPVVRRSVLS